MKIYNKRIISFLISIVMLFLTFFNYYIPVNAATSSGAKGNIKWELINGVLTISSNTGEVVDIPDSVELGFPKNEVTKIVIDTTINSVGKGPLTDCDNVSSIVIPDSVTSIKPHAFFMKPEFSAKVFMCNEVELISNNQIAKDYDWLSDNINIDKNATLHKVTFEKGDTATLLATEIRDYYDGEHFGFTSYLVPSGYKIRIIPLADTLTTYFKVAAVDKIVNDKVENSFSMDSLDKLYNQPCFKEGEAITSDTVFKYRCEGIKQENIRVSYVDKNLNKELMESKNIPMTWLDEGPLSAPEIKGYRVTNPTEKVMWSAYVYGEAGQSGIHMNFGGSDLPSGEEISSWRHNITFYYTAKQYDYIVKYVDSKTGQELLPNKTEQADFNSTVTEIAPEIKGYSVDATRKELVMQESENVIIFYYNNTQVPYTVQYVDVEGHKLLEDKTGVGNYFGEVITEYAPEIKGYTPEMLEQSHMIVEGENLIIFKYIPNQYDYTVQYLEKDTNISLANDNYGTGIYNTTITEMAVDIKGYIVDEESKSIIIDETDNVITFYYTAIPYEYTVHYVDDKGKTLLPDKIASGKINQNITEKAADITGYTPDTESKNIKITEGKNELSFIYTPNKYKYTVKYVDIETGKALLPDKNRESTFGATVVEKAPSIDAYTVDKNEKSIIIKEADNVIIFNYKSQIPYTVQYVDLKHNPLIPEKTVLVENEGLVTEKYVPVYGYEVNKVQQELDVKEGVDNTITFVYSEKTKSTEIGKGYFSDNELVEKSSCINGIYINSKFNNDKNIFTFNLSQRYNIPSKINASMDILLPSGTPTDILDIYNSSDIQIDENGFVIMPFDKDNVDVTPLEYTVSHTDSNEILTVDFANDEVLQNNSFGKSIVFVDTSEQLTNIDVKINAKVTSTVNGGGFSNVLEDNTTKITPHHYQNIIPDISANMFTYSENQDSTITITGFTDEYKNKLQTGEVNGRVQIPSVYDGKKVKGVGEKAFKDNSYIEYVSIADSIETIGKRAFYNCPNIFGIDMGGSIKEIGVNAFYIGVYTKTHLLLQNDIAFDYDWFGDNRKVRIVVDEDGNQQVVIPDNKEEQESTFGYKVVEEALKHLGNPFQYGAAGPTAFDSGGLVYYCYNMFGISVPRNPSAMMQLPSVPEPQEGDIVIFNNASAVGIFIGNGQMVSCVNNGRGVSIMPIQRVIKFVRPVY